MEPLTSFLSGLFTIVLLDLVLAGDNAIVIALAARRLPKPLQKKAVFWGSFGAVGLLLLPIAWKLLKQDDTPHDVAAAGSFWAALRTIVVADALMGLDNVLA